LSALTSYRHQIQAGDIAVILDSLQELFRERGETVTPKQLAERMENKMQRHVHYTYATYLCTNRKEE
jgi:mannitol-specific phosphotransferase system IIBC component